MTTENPARSPNPTDLLIDKIKATLDEPAAQTEITHLKQLKEQILSLEAYYLMMHKVHGQRSQITLSAQGVLLKKVRNFGHHLGRLGLDPENYTTTSAILTLFPHQS